MYLLHNTFNASFTDLFYKVILLILGKMLLNYSQIINNLETEISDKYKYKMLKRMNYEVWVLVKTTWNA